MNEDIIQPPAPAEDLRITLRPLGGQTFASCIVAIRGAQVDPLLVAETLRLRGWAQRPWGIGLVVQARASAIEPVLRAAGFEVTVAEQITLGGKAA